MNPPSWLARLLLAHARNELAHRDATIANLTCQLTRAEATAAALNELRYQKRPYGAPVSARPDRDLFDSNPVRQVRR